MDGAWALPMSLSDSATVTLKIASQFKSEIRNEPNGWNYKIH